MGFLGDLANQLGSQLGLVTNNTTTLDSVIDGQQTKYGTLGDFAQQFDQSAERSYLEEGYLRVDPYQTQPRQFEVMWQQPSATVLVKKKMFNSIAENYRPDYFDSDEALYYKAMCLLFQNKCQQISALEALSKIQQVTAAVGNVSEQLFPYIVTLADACNNGYAGANVPTLFSVSNPFTTQDATAFFQTVDRLRTVYAYNRTAQYTTWLTDPLDLFQSTRGPGSGVIEITNFTNISTNTSVDFQSPGSFQLAIVDPYQSMLITDWDIEIALSDATNSYYQNQAVQFGAVAANQTINDFQNKLNEARSNRNASPITFKVDPNTIFGQPVIAIIDRLGLQIQFSYDAFGGLVGSDSAVNVPADYLRGGNLAGYDGLDTATVPIGPNNDIKPLFGNSELSLFTQVILSIFQQLQLLKSTTSNIKVDYNSTNYARRKLRFNFGGKLIIQPMDTVHIYMNTKSQYDNKILSGLQQMFTGFGALDNIESNINSVLNGISTLLNPSGNLQLQAEKAIYVGADFPNYLWYLLRSQFVSEIEGTHVFAGVVKTAVDNWSDGKFTINVSGSDNTIYFQQGKVNFKPGTDSFNGLIFDPLTPFVSNWDSFSGNASAAVTSQNTSNTPQLLDENMDLIAETPEESLVKFKQGALVGEKVTQGNFIQDQIIDPSTGRLSQTMYLPDGMVYKWKQGIGIFSRSGTSQTINNPALVGNPTLYNEPFAGLDVMNVLSLLICGVPYNYATYIKGTGDINSLRSDPNDKQTGAKSFYESLRNDLLTTNVLWGNFVPFKSITMNQSAVALAMQAQITATNISSDLDKKLNQLSELNTSMASLGAINVLTQTRNVQFAQDSKVQSQLNGLQTQATQLQSSINAAISDLQQATQQANAQIQMTPTFMTNSLTSSVTDPNDPEIQEQIRNEINYLTRRMSYDVRGNTDQNLLIVDDYYDQDYDIAAFNSSLGDLKLFYNDYTNVSEKIKHVADMLNLEVFADSQGHIRIRPPQYNKMPSSIFYRMLYLQQTLGIQVYPQFLVNLFTNQLNYLSSQIEITEDYIRLMCAILSQYPSIDQTGDDTAMDFISGNNVTSGSGGTFAFVSSPSGIVTSYDLLIQQANQEEATQTLDLSLGNFGAIEASALDTTQLFTSSQRYQTILSALSAQNSAAAGSNTNSATSTSIFASSVVQQLITRIQTNSGQSVNSKDYLTTPGPNQPIELSTGQTVDIFKVTQNLQTYIQQWQSQVKNFYHTIKNAAEVASLEVDNSTSNQLGTPGIFGNGFIPDIYQNMIEDETFDDYGLGSGARYVIRANQIKNLTIQENEPPFTSVEVHGSISPLFDPATGGGGPPGYFQLPSGGNGVTSAIAIDYDMWRFYGFKQPHVINMPMFKDAVAQCGPYAAMVLSRNRSNILRGSVTISGNEFMQVGEVIYLEDRNLLFYVTSVKHNYTEGQTFTTTLDLSYGHSIGDYIPSYLDVIGKVIFKNQANVNNIVQRQDNSGKEKNLGVVQLDGQNPDADVLYTGAENETINGYSGTNQTVLNTVLYTAFNLINANGAFGNNQKAAVELRVYYDDSTGSADENLINAAEEALNFLIGSLQGPQNFPGSGVSISSGGGAANNTISLPSDSVSIQPVNMDDETDYRSPSQQALAAARNQVQATSTNSGSPSPSNPQNGYDGTDAAGLAPSNDDIRTTLFSYIVDCWIVFTTVPSTQASDSTYNPVNAGS